MFEDDLNRARDLIKNGNKLHAREILEQIVQSDPHNENAWMWLADTYPDNPNRYVVLKQCLKHNPNGPFVQQWLATVKFDHDLNGVIDLLKNGQEAEAREILERMVQDDPQIDTAWIWFAQTYPDATNRIEVLQEGLKHNPTSHIIQRWLTALGAEESGQATTQPDLPGNKIDQAGHDQENDPEVPGSSQNPQEKRSKRKGKFFFPYVILAGIYGFIFLGSLNIFGGSTPQKQGFFSAIWGIKSISSLPTSAQVPARTQTMSLAPSLKTPAATLVPSITSSPTEVINPSMISTEDATKIFSPMPGVAQQARSAVLNQGFKPERTACGQDPSCQAFLNENPYMLIVIMDNGLVTITFFDETISYQDNAQNSGGSAPGDPELITWYVNIIAEIYNPLSTDFKKDAAVVIDRVMKYGSYDWESYYGYKIRGTQSIDKKITLTITPP